MATTLVVDGYNAINAIPRTRKILLEGNLEEARKVIMAMARTYARSSGYINNVFVVFDGDDKYRELDDVNPLPGDHSFSRTNKGDDQIIATVKRYSGFSRVIIASNDNYVRNMSRGYGASLMNPEDLETAKAKGKEKKEKGKSIDKKTRDAITDEYMRELGLG